MIVEMKFSSITLLLLIGWQIWLAEAYYPDLHPGSERSDSVETCKVSVVKFDLQYELFFEEELCIFNNTNVVRFAKKFESNMHIKIIIHGYNESCSTAWIKDMARSLFDMGYKNVLCLNNRFDDPYYPFLVERIPILAEIYAYFLNGIKFEDSFYPPFFHIIAYSINSHLAGAIGSFMAQDTSSLNSIDHITALDPSGLFLDYLDSEQKLDSSDATFVDAIHTDGFADVLAFGTLERVGHVDYYPNGGFMQPNCSTKAVRQVNSSLYKINPDVTFCHSRRAISIYMEWIKIKRNIYAFECKDYATFQLGLCFDHEDRFLLTNFHKHFNDPHLDVSRYTLTFGTPPYTGYQVHVDIESSRALDKGQFFVRIDDKLLQPEINFEYGITRHTNNKKRKSYMLLSPYVLRMTSNISIKMEDRLTASELTHLRKIIFTGEDGFLGCIYLEERDMFYGVWYNYNLRTEFCLPFASFKNDPRFPNSYHRLRDYSQLSNVKEVIKAEKHIADFVEFKYVTGRLRSKLFNYSSANCQKFDFNTEAETKIIVHGYKNRCFTNWVNSLAEELLKKNYRVICLQHYANETIPYYDWRERLPLFASYYGKFLDECVNNFSSIKPMHIIGSGTGAHLAGLIAEVMEYNVDQITGLDPAGPLYEEYESNIRLDSSQAKFVEVIHTDGKPSKFNLGSLSRMGDVDYYPNGGLDQPQCSILIEERRIHQCQHATARSIYLDWIKKNTTFHAFPCLNYDIFKEGRCLDKTIAGFLTNKTYHKNKFYYLSTKDKYEVNYVIVKINRNHGLRGILNIEVNNYHLLTVNYSSSTHMRGNSGNITETHLSVLTVKVMEKSYVVLTYTHHGDENLTSYFNYISFSNETEFTNTLCLEKWRFDEPLHAILRQRVCSSMNLESHPSYLVIEKEEIANIESPGNLPLIKIFHYRNGEGLSEKEFQGVNIINSILSTDFKQGIPTNVIIPKPGGNCDETWIRNMSLAFHEKDRNNIICFNIVVNHEPFSEITQKNLSFTSKFYADFLDMLIANGIITRNLHLIGYKTGAHMAATIAFNMYYHVSRITGLDPTAFHFEHAANENHLDRYDAQFVDVIHTHSEDEFSLNKFGDVDYYPNGGVSQPGCSDNSQTDSQCHDLRAAELFIEWIVDTKLHYAFKCENYDAFLDGQCFSERVLASYDVNQQYVEQNVYFKTNTYSPYMGYHTKWTFIGLQNEITEFTLHISTGEENDMIVYNAGSAGNTKASVVLLKNSFPESGILSLKFDGINPPGISLKITSILLEEDEKENGNMICFSGEITSGETYMHILPLMLNSCD